MLPPGLTGLLHKHLQRLCAPLMSPIKAFVPIIRAEAATVLSNGSFSCTFETPPLEASLPSEEKCGREAAWQDAGLSSEGRGRPSVGHTSLCGPLKIFGQDSECFLNKSP